VLVEPDYQIKPNTMEFKTTNSNINIERLKEAATVNGYGLNKEPFSTKNLDTVFEKMEAFKNLVLRHGLDDILPMGKRSFLVYKHHKYFTVSTKDIAFFFIRHECTIIVCADRQEFIVNQSLDQIQSLIIARQFFRVNRQYLVNFTSVKEVEHYFARKLSVNLFTPTPEKLLVPKEKATQFLQWLEDR
jgi:DNA-binding LytR/AlgR family response regulator